MLIVLEKSFWKESVEINKTYYIFGQVEGTEELQMSKSVMISDNLLSWRKGPTDRRTPLHAVGTGNPRAWSFPLAIGATWLDVGGRRTWGNQTGSQYHQHPFVHLMPH